MKYLCLGCGESWIVVATRPDTKIFFGFKEAGTTTTRVSILSSCHIDAELPQVPFADTEDPPQIFESAFW